MDVHGLSQEDRDRLKRALAERRDYLQKLVRWMQRNGWNGNDPVLNCLISAEHALHAAVNCFPVPPASVKAEIETERPGWMKAVG